MNWRKIEERITDFIRSVVETAKADGVVVGISGGLDSSVTVALCVRALGKDRVLGIAMPTSFTPKDDLEDALKLAESLGIRASVVPIDSIIEAFEKQLPLEPKNRLVLGNLRARVRMTILYYFANNLNYLVAGTSDRSEILIGFYTKYGDGASDFMPIAHLYKTEVRKLAGYLGLPKKIIVKPSSPQLWPGHTLTEELPADYEVIDPILKGLFDKRLKPKDISEGLKVPMELVQQLEDRYIRTSHKRRMPTALLDWEP
ncbi:MAG: NAD+ synthase [Candidatus Bathyarchaeia archaeon]